MPLKSPEDLTALEAAITTYLRLPERERTREARVSALRILKLPNPQRFLDSVWSPQWEGAVDRLLDPMNLRFRPLEINDFHFKWAQGSFNHLPQDVRARLISFKIRPTGLEAAVDELLKSAGFGPTDWKIVDLEVVGKVHVESVATLELSGGKAVKIELSHFSPAAEKIYESVASRAGLPTIPTVVHTTPGRGKTLLQIALEGVNLVSPEANTEFFALNWRQILEGVARLDALGDALGTIVRDAHHLYTPEGQVVSIHNYELFHELRQYRFGFLDPIYITVDERLPSDVDVGAEDRLDGLYRHYRELYLDEQRRLQLKWDEMESCLYELGPWIEDYEEGRRPKEKVVEGVRERLFRDGEAWLDHIYSSFVE
jgi:hypothetical protein